MNRPGSLNYQKFPNKRIVRAGMTHSAAKTPKDREQDKEIKTLKRKVTQLARQSDLHYRDTFYTAAMTSTGAIVSINPLSQGDDFDQRIGEGVKSKYLSMRVRFNRPASASADTLRLIIYWDTQFNGAGGSISGLGDGLLDDTTITQIQMAPLNYRCRERYIILLDKTYLFDPNSTLTNNVIYKKYNFNLYNKNVQFADSGGTFSSITKNSLNFFVASSNTGITQDLGFRYWFIDP